MVIIYFIGRNDSVNKEYEYEIKADYDKLVISLGEWSFDCTERSHFHKKGSILDISTQVLQKNGYGTIPYQLGKPYSKQVYQTFTSKFKVKPKIFVNIINKLHYKVLAKGLNKSVLHSICYSGPFKRHLDIPSNYRDVKPLVLQCVRDGISNVAPLVAVTGMEPAALKSNLGKGLWKKYCKRSLTANTIVSHTIRDRTVEDPIEALKELYLIPITFLKYSEYKYSTYRSVIGRILRQERKSTALSEYRDIYQIVQDTHQMAEDLGEKVNPDWSLKRFKEEHERLALLQLEGSFSSEKFSSETYMRLPEVFKGSLGVARLLTSELEVAKEGRIMHHCVGGYASSCTGGIYAVYHISDKLGGESTLGLRCGEAYKDMSSVWRFNQHYSHNNMNPSKDCCVIGEELLRDIVT